MTEDNKDIKDLKDLEDISEEDLAKAKELFVKELPDDLKEKISTEVEDKESE